MSLQTFVPKRMGQFWQKVGRAGRDGSPSVAALLNTTKVSKSPSEVTEKKPKKKRDKTPDAALLQMVDVRLIYYFDI